MSQEGVPRNDLHSGASLTAVRVASVLTVGHRMVKPPASDIKKHLITGFLDHASKIGPHHRFQPTRRTQEIGDKRSRPLSPGFETGHSRM